MPFGGHKGYALSVVAELIGRGLAAGAADDGRDTPYSLFILALDPAATGTAEGFLAPSTSWCGDVRARAEAAGAQVTLPGEPEARARAERREHGVPVPPTIWNSLLELRDRLGRRGAHPGGGLMSAAGAISTSRARPWSSRARPAASARRWPGDSRRAAPRSPCWTSTRQASRRSPRSCGRAAPRCSPVAATPPARPTSSPPSTPTEQELGGPHVLVNNAARGSHTRPEELTLEEWNGVIAVSLTGLLPARAGVRAPHAGRGLRARSSTSPRSAALSAIGRGNFAYDVSKAGVSPSPASSASSGPAGASASTPWRPARC